MMYELARRFVMSTNECVVGSLRCSDFSAPEGVPMENTTGNELGSEVVVAQLTERGASVVGPGSSFGGLRGMRWKQILGSCLAAIH